MAVLVEAGQVAAAGTAVEAVAQVAVGTVEADTAAELAGVVTEGQVGRADTVETADVAVLDRDIRLLIRFTATPTLNRGISFHSFQKVLRPTRKCCTR